VGSSHRHSDFIFFTVLYYWDDEKEDELDVKRSADDDIINAYKISVRKSNSKRPLERH
jgi:hypothetical protein